MAVFPLLAVTFVMSVIAALFVICCVVLILIILIQKGKGGGLSGTFGGGMASGILGSKTGDFLTWFTIALVGVFLMLAVVMAKFYKPSVSDFGAGPVFRQQQPQSPGQPVGREQPAPIDDVGTATRDTSAEVNLPGG